MGYRITETSRSQSGSTTSVPEDTQEDIEEATGPVEVPSKKKGRPWQTHCKRGHEYGPDDVQIRNGLVYHHCKKCNYTMSLKQEAERKEKRKRRTHCKSGHPLTVKRYGNRYCDTCSDERKARRAAANTHCPNGHEFTSDSVFIDNRGTRVCRVCHNDRQNSWASKFEQRKRLFIGARSRASKRGIPFSITISDIIIPDVCPALGVLMEGHRGESGPFTNSPTIDRFIPSLGYVPGNISVISHKANALKRDGTTEEVGALYRWMLSRSSATLSDDTSYLRHKY
jgi:hypothetical protein